MEIAAKSTAPSRPKPPQETSLRARTAFDKYFRADRADTYVAVAPCIAAKDLNLAAWVDNGDFVGQVASYRGALLDEFDQPRVEVVRSLARLYILNGFGAEAEQLIFMFGADLGDAEVLRELSLIVDGRTLQPGGPIARTAPCHGSALLWRRVAGLPRAKSVPDSAVWEELAEVFSALPQRIRELVAAPLLTSLVSSGEVAQADKLNLILSRAPIQVTASLDLARAKLLAAGGQAAAAEGLYERLARQDGLEAGESLIRLLDSKLARGAPISDALADALSDLAFRARGHALELAAKTAEIRAHAAMDGPVAALDAVQIAFERMPENAAVLRDAGHAALEQLSVGRDEKGIEAANYAKAVMAYEPLVSTGKDGDAARRKVGKELVSLGLPNAALAYLEPALTRGDSATRVVAASALIAMGRPQEAREALGTVATDEAHSLRAQALAREGDFVGAAAIEPDNKARALSAGDWETVADGEGPRAALSGLMAATVSGESRPEAESKLSLTGARAARDAAQATRALIREALNDG